MMMVVSGIKGTRGENMYELTCGHLMIAGTELEMMALMVPLFGIDCVICSEMIEP